MFDAVLQELQPFARVFADHGKCVYLVGGAVRNLLLGRPAKDFDFTTDALPDEVQSYFRKVLPTGLQHGTVTVLFQGASYEVTTFRVDGEYTDGRRPDTVSFTRSLEEDLKRRDFTINAIALDLETGILADPHDGQGDLRHGVLRTVGSPARRFEEDALRLLRLFRFAAQLGFDIEAATLEAVPPLRSRLASVSKERIRDELRKALAGAYPERAWTPLQQMGFLADQFQPAPRTLSEGEMEQLSRLPDALRWSFWLTLTLGWNPSLWEAQLKRLVFSNAEIAAVLGPASALGFPPAASSAKAVIEAWGSRERVALGIDFLTALQDVGAWMDDGLLAELPRAVNAPVFLSELAVSGKDLLSWGVKPGPEVGRWLKKLQKAVWDDPALNRLEALRALWK